jgi:outer membrane lipoprotein carrier protein
VQVVLDRLDRAQQAIQTLKADVVETRTLALLSRPEVFRGAVSFERPGKIRWEYSAPEKRVYVLADGSLTGWIPSRNQVEQINVSRYEKRLRRLVAFGQDSRTLLKDFNVSLAVPPSVAGADELVLAPRSHRMARKVREVRIAVDRKSGLPRRIEYVTGRGNRVALELVNLLVNHALASDAFVLRIPPDARVVHGLPSLGFDVAASEMPGSD